MNLVLPLNAEYFNAIKAGEKDTAYLTEEQREAYTNISAEVKELLGVVFDAA